MEDLKIIKGNGKLPNFHFRKDGVLRFWGKSLPENVQEEYAPVLNWIEEYLKNPRPVTEVIIDFDYLNSPTIKILVFIFDKIKKTEKTHLKVKWYYIDEDTYDIAKDISEILDLPVETIRKAK